MKQSASALHPLLGGTEHLTLVGKAFENLINKSKHERGYVIAFSGVSGCGKSFVLNSIIKEFSKGDRNQSDAYILHTDCSHIVAQKAIGKIQPYGPFRRIIDQLQELDTPVAYHLKKTSEVAFESALRFATQTLKIENHTPFANKAREIYDRIQKQLFYYSTIPKQNIEPTIHAGTLDFMLSELEKQAVKADAQEEILNKIVLTLCFLSTAQRPLVIILDNLDKCDRQSFHCLTRLVQQIEANRNIPILLVYSYSENSPGRDSALFAFHQQKQILSKTAVSHHIELFKFKHDDIVLACKKRLIDDSNLERINEAGLKNCAEWLLKKSEGIPSAVLQYLYHFQISSPFRDGIFEEPTNKSYLPLEIQHTYEIMMESLPESDRFLLILGCIEGRSFTAIMLSKILKMDVLQLIQKLRSLSQRTHCIFSIGKGNRYTIESTVYEFADMQFYTYLHSILEFEEETLLHEKISAELKELYTNAPSQLIANEEIAPYLAIHSYKSGDRETTKTMLQASLNASMSLGAQEEVEQIQALLHEQTQYQESFTITRSEQPISTSTLHHTSEEIPPLWRDFNAEEAQKRLELLGKISFVEARAKFQEFLRNNDILSAKHFGEEYLSQFGISLTEHNILEWQNLLTTTYIILQNLDEAFARVQSTYAKAVRINEPTLMCIALNIRAGIYTQRGEYREAFRDLDNARECILSEKLQLEYELLTTYNTVRYFQHLPANDEEVVANITKLQEAITAMEQRLGISA